MIASGAVPRAQSLFANRADMLLASFVLNVAGLALPLLLLQLYDRIIPQAAYGTLAAMLVGVSGAVVMEYALRHARTSIASWVAAREEHALSIAAVQGLLRADPRHAPPPGIQADRLAAIGEWRSHRTGDLSHSLADVPFVLVYLGFLAWLSPVLAATALACLLPGVLAAVALAPAAARAIAARTETEGHRHGLTHEVLGGIESLKALGAESAMQRRHDRLVAAAAAAGRRTAAAVQHCAALAAAGSQTVVAGVALVGAWAVMEDSLSAGALAAAILLASRGTEPLARLAGATPALVRARAARARVNAQLALPVRRAGGTPSGGIRSIALSDVRILRDDGTLLLREVSLQVVLGECVAIRGPGGSGKSRLLAVLAGLAEPDGGTVLVNGWPRRTLDLDELRRHVALLPQFPALVPGRVMDNLTCFNPALEPEARRLAAELGLDGFFGRHPAGYGMKVGGGDGQDLPAAVAGRVAAVRALVGGARLVLFDSANAAQDREGDTRMRRLIQRLRPHAALVIVTDRPSWLALADRQYRIADGTLQPVAAALPA